MEETTLALVNKLPSWYLELMIPILIFVAILVFSRLKRDKNGKLYWFSQSYESRKHDRKLDELIKHDKAQDETLKYIEKDTMRLAIYDTDLPDIERFWAAARYLSKGYNAETKEYINSVLIPSNEDLWKMVSAIVKKGDRG
jgi:hypothetical protein